jgi:hypothetical protein
MGLRNKMRRLEAAARGNLESFILEDGSRHWYDVASGERFLHSLACLRAQGEGKTTFPEPPETVRAPPGRGTGGRHSLRSTIPVPSISSPTIPRPSWSVGSSYPALWWSGVS